MISSPSRNAVLSTIKSNKVIERRSLVIGTNDDNGPTSGTKTSGCQQLFTNPTNPKYHNRSSPPFRVGGRGSKQLTKALQQSEEITLTDDSDGENGSNTNWMLCTSSPICFAKVVSVSSHDKTMIQPLRLNPLDSCLLIPWEGHVWLAKNENLIPVKVLYLRTFVFVFLCKNNMLFR